MTQTCRIKCKARQGAFKQEMIVRFPIVSAAGEIVEVQSFAYGDSVTMRGGKKLGPGEEADAELEAYQLGERKGLVSVVLPQPTFQNGPSVRVKKELLV